jgi:uncharacterized surface protein with fasciclin (FAS1) repeats
MGGKNINVSVKNGGKAKVTVADVNQFNGVIHAIDALILAYF